MAASCQASEIFPRNRPRNLPAGDLRGGLFGMPPLCHKFERERVSAVFLSMPRTANDPERPVTFTNLDKLYFPNGFTTVSYTHLTLPTIYSV